MKLYNKTSYPDDLLESLLVEAGKAVNARTSNVIVKVTSTKAGNHQCRGIATRCDWVRRFALDTKAYKKGTKELKEGMVSTDGGYFRLVVPYPFLPDWVKQTESFKRGYTKHDGLNIAEVIYSIACHEWQHIKQYQDGKFYFKDKKERAKHHDNRVWEKDAIKAASKATNNPKDKTQETILNLALWIEQNK